MALNGKTCLLTNGMKLLGGQADLYLNHSMALGTGQMVVMASPTDAVMVGSVCELDAIEQTCIDKNLYRAINGGPAQTRLFLT